MIRPRIGGCGWRRENDFDPVRIPCCALGYMAGEYLVLMRNVLAIYYYASIWSRDMLTAAKILKLGQPLPQRKCGIYFLIRDGVVDYVGLSIDVVQRVRYHASRRPFDCWAWVECAEDELESTERTYIDALQPAGNTDPITVTKRLISKNQQRPPKMPTNGRPVETPVGRFESVQAAGKHHGISHQAAWVRARKGRSGWRFIEAPKFHIAP